MKERTVLVAQAATVQEELPARVQEALGELVSAAREGLLALSVGVGLGVLAELMEEEVVGVVGAKGKHDPERVAVRHGRESGAVTLGGRRVAVEHPLTRLGIKGSLKHTLASTNPCESMIECVRRTSRNVKRWSSGEMGLRWTAAGMLEAERQFRRVIGYRDLAKLALAAKRELHRHPIQEVTVTLA